MKAFLFVILLLIISVCLMHAEKSVCVELGDCMLCPTDELSNDFCLQTKRKIKISCNDGTIATEYFRACELTKEDEKFRVIIFQLIVGIIGGLAYWCVQIKKRKSMSQFDSRRLQAHR